MEDWALIRRLVAEGVPQRQVARDLGIGRETVRRALAAEGPPKYERAPAPTAFDVFEPRVRALLEDHPGMPASVIAERVGWTGSMTWFRDNVRRLRPLYRRPDPADRLTWEAGDAAQCDLVVPAEEDPAGERHQQSVAGVGDHGCLLQVCAGQDDPDQDDRGSAAGDVAAAPDLGQGAQAVDLGQRAGHRSGSAPLCWGAGVHGNPGHQSWCCSRPGTRRAKGWWNAGTAGSRPRSCRAVASLHRPTSTTSSLAGWRRRTSGWCAPPKPSRWTGWRRIGPRMLPLPPVPPVVGWRKQVRLGRDYYVRVASQRLLGRPDLDRPHGRHPRRPRTGPGQSGWQGWWLSIPGSGPAA